MCRQAVDVRGVRYIMKGEWKEGRKEGRKKERKKERMDGRMEGGKEGRKEEGRKEDLCGQHAQHLGMGQGRLVP
jgi:hypothetical protein